MENIVRKSTRIKKLHSDDADKSKIINPSENTKIDHQKSLKSETKDNKREKTIIVKGEEDLKLIKDLDPLDDPPTTPWEKKISSARFPYSFYNQPCEDLAKNMLGKILVRKLDDGTILKGKIVETESYLGLIDKASATYQGKVTSRNVPMYMIPGAIFVYLTYGMYHCFNISSQDLGSSVLLRALEPLEGTERMKEFRNLKNNAKASKKAAKDFKNHELCNGPSKLCIAFDISREQNKYSMGTYKGMWIEDNSNEEKINIVCCPRIGIDSAGPEWANKPLRFYIYNNQSVSKRDKKAEACFSS